VLEYAINLLPVKMVLIKGVALHFERHRLNYYQLDLIIACRDLGQNCDCVIQGETEEKLMKNAAEHAVKDQGYKEDIMTPQMKEKIKSHIRNVTGMKVRAEKEI